MQILLKLQKYMGKRKILLPISLLCSALSAILGMLPYIFVWLIIKGMLSGGVNSSVTSQYAWWAFSTALASVAIYFIALTLSHLVAFRVEVNLRREAMQKIIHLPLGFFNNNTTGKIRKIIDEDASMIHSFLAHQLPDLVGSILIPIMTLLLVLVFDWKLGLICMIPLVIAMFIMRSMMGKKGGLFMKKYMRSLEEMNTEAVEYVRGIPVVKVFQQTIYSFKSFHKSIMNYKDMVYQYTLLREKPMSAYSVIIHGFPYFLVIGGVVFIAISGGQLNLILNLILFVIITPIFAQNAMRSMHFNHASLQAKQAIQRMEDLTQNPTLSITQNPKHIAGHQVSFQNVSFTYPENKEKAIDGVSFEIPEGETFALVGASGSGKSTTARLLPRFWDVDEGEILIGDINVKEIDPEELMQQISFIFQNTKLFKASLLENVRYGNPDATEDEIKQVLKIAQCEEIVAKMPKGLTTRIGSKGVYLSGGEMQRISLARAILKNASIVILDEATAFADPENEHLIQQAFHKLTQNKTVLMIAHRLTSVVDADCILVMNKGKILERGTHTELLKKEGLYTKMWKEYQKSAHWTINQ